VSPRALRGRRPSLILLALAVLAAAGVSAWAGDSYEALRHAMVEQQVKQRGITKPEVLAAMEQVPRHLFVPDSLRAQAYGDNPLMISPGQSLYQPYVVALMTSKLDLKHGDKVLEIGTGSGYQTAILARLVREVYSAELEPELAAATRDRLAQLDITNVVLGIGNGIELFREHAPFDAILSAAAPRSIPEELLGQLAEGGRCVIPVGGADMQHLWLIERKDGALQRSRLDPVRFVPLRDRAGSDQGP
jgi:protein-L-isoaspartate(D-aspartate) O-methyltransferase